MSPTKAREGEVLKLSPTQLYNYTEWYLRQAKNYTKNGLPAYANRYLEVEVFYARAFIKSI